MESKQSPGVACISYSSSMHGLQGEGCCDAPVRAVPTRRAGTRLLVVVQFKMGEMLARYCRCALNNQGRLIIGTWIKMNEWISSNIPVWRWQRGSAMSSLFSVDPVVYCIGVWHDRAVTSRQFGPLLLQEPALCWRRQTGGTWRH